MLNSMFPRVRLLAQAIMSLTDSAANFEASALKLGLDASVLKLLVDGGVDTVAKYAFVSSFVPGGSDKKPFLGAIRSLLKREPSIGELSVLRRLHVECYSLTAAELKQQVERTADAPAKQLAAPDRADRLAKQKGRYPGLSISGPHEPSDRLVDRCVQIYEQNRLVHIPLNFCVSKEDEIKNYKDKEDRLMSVDSVGHVHIKHAAVKVEAELSTDLLVRFALTRRGLAMEQAGLMDFKKHEAWSEKLINSRFREVPQGYSRISLQQLFLADKQAFIVAADLCRAGVQVNAHGRRMDGVWSEVMSHADVVHFLQPLPTPPPAPHAVERPGPHSPKGGKGKGKGGAKGYGKNRQTRIPDDLAGCHANTTKGHPVCFDHQRGTCKRPLKLNRCVRGLHVCGICFHNSHDMRSCPKKAAE